MISSVAPLASAAMTSVCFDSDANGVCAVLKTDAALVQALGT